MEADDDDDDEENDEGAKVCRSNEVDDLAMTIIIMTTIMKMVVAVEIIKLMMLIQVLEVIAICDNEDGSCSNHDIGEAGGDGDV